MAPQHHIESSYGSDEAEPPGSAAQELEDVLSSPNPLWRLLLLLLSVTAVFVSPQRDVWAHGFRPEVVSLTLSRAMPGAVHGLTNNQGIFANLSGTYRWICEDAVYPFAKTQGLALYGAAEERWLVATNHGLHVSFDGGCDFEAVDHELGGMRLTGLWRHDADDALITISGEPGVPNRVFLSRDEGRTWSVMDLSVEGVFRGFHWLPSVEPGFILHTDAAIYRVGLETRGHTVINVSSAQLEVPVEQVLKLSVSPADPQRLLALAEAGDRGRLLLTVDGGGTWSDVALLTEADVSLLFSHNGLEAIAQGAFGGRWRSGDSGGTWAPEADGPVVVRCLTRGLDGEIYGCSNPNADGPWAIGRSGDFGRTWAPVLNRFEDTVHRKDCPADGRTFMCCRGRCPGDSMTCGQPVNVEWPPECYEGVPPELFPDMGVADAEAGAVDMTNSRDGEALSFDTDGGMDSQDANSAPSPDAAPSGGAGAGGGGCVQTVVSSRPGADHSVGTILMMVGLMIVVRSRWGRVH